MTTADSAQRGSVAILALWAMTIVAVLLAAAGATTRSEALIARNMVAAARARMAAEAGTQLGLERLLRRHTDVGAAFDGTPELWQDGSTRVEIAIADEAGKIDINLAPLELLAGLFSAVGEPPETALLLACNVLDRRGETGPGCPQPGFGAPPTPHRFAMPEELAQVPGINPTLYDAIADDVTVATGASAIAPLVAPRTVLLAVPGATAAMVDSFLDGRREAGAAALPVAAGPVPFLMSSPGRDFTISAVATTADRARYRADLQVRLTEQPNRPYEVIAWRTPPVDRGRRATAASRRVP
jgi:general secretion pathway protein K